MVDSLSQHFKKCRQYQSITGLSIALEVKKHKPHFIRRRYLGHGRALLYNCKKNEKCAETFYGSLWRTSEKSKKVEFLDGTLLFALSKKSHKYWKSLYKENGATFITLASLSLKKI